MALPPTQADEPSSSSSTQTPRAQAHLRHPSSPSLSPLSQPRHAPSHSTSSSSSMVIVSPSEWLPDWWPTNKTVPSPPPFVKPFAPARFSYLQRVSPPLGDPQGRVTAERKPAFRARGLDLTAVGGGPWERRVGWVGTWCWTVGEQVVWLFFDFSTAYILLLLAIAQPRPWALAPAIYLSCFLAWIIVLLRQTKIWWSVWKQKSPPILTIYLSPYSHLLTSLISPSHHAFLSHISQSTLTRSDRLTHSSFQILQTYPSTLLVLPRAALALMLVLGGAGKSFEGLEVQEDGLYFEEGKEELTLYATVVLCVFVGATWARTMVLMGAWMVVWRKERKEGKGGSGEVEKGGVLMIGKGWRGRLDERILEIFDACVTHPWPNNSSTVRRSASSVRVSQLGRSPAPTHHLAASSPSSRKPSPRPSNLRNVQPSAQQNPRRSNRTSRSPNSRFFVGRAEPRSQPIAFTPPLRSAPVIDPSSSHSRGTTGTTIVDRSLGTDSTPALDRETNEDEGPGLIDTSRAPSWDSFQASRQQQRQPHPFPPSPPAQARTPPSATAFPTLPQPPRSPPPPPPLLSPAFPFTNFNSPSPASPQSFSASSPPPPSSYLPGEDFFEELQSERPASTAGGFAVPAYPSSSSNLLTPRRSTEAQERDRRTSTRTFGRPYSMAETDPDSPLLEPPPRGKFSAISRVDSTTSSVGEPAVANRATMTTTRGTLVGGAMRLGGGDGTGGRRSVEVATTRKERERLSVEVGEGEPHARASTEPTNVSGRHRPSSLLVPESERTGRKSWSEPTI